MRVAVSHVVVAVFLAAIFAIPKAHGEGNASSTRNAIAATDAAVHKADVIFAFDTTGSMGGEITNVQNALLTTIIPQIRASVPDVAFGLVDFRDFGEVSPSFLLKYRHRVQTVVTPSGVNSIQTAVLQLAAAGGGDFPEAGWEALYSIAGGPAITVMEYSSVFDLANTNPTTVTPGEQQGTVGGAGFRTGALPIVVAITDAEWHDAPGSGGLNEYPASLAGVPSRANAIDRLNAINARVISIVSAGGMGDPRTQGALLAEATGATVLPADWGAAADRPAGCAVTQCCTALNGAGATPSPSGKCPLVYSVDANGAGIGSVIVKGVQMLLLASRDLTSNALSSSSNPSVPGQMVTFTATVSVTPPGSGTPTGTVTFRDDTTTLGTGSLSGGQATFGTSALALGSHSITATYEGDGDFSGSTSSPLTQTVQMISPPTGVTAAMSSPTSVLVTWLESAGAASYEISRSSSGLAFDTTFTSSTLSFEDTTASSNTAYLYVVRAVDGLGGMSDPSNADLATTVTLTPIVPQSTTIKADHLTQLRAAVQAVRTLAVRPPADFTDVTIDNTVAIRAVHVSELQSALDDARQQLPLPLISFTAPAAGTTIQAADFQQLRLGVQ